MRLIDADALPEGKFQYGEGEMLDPEFRKGWNAAIDDIVAKEPTIEPPVKCIANVTVDTEKLLECIKDTCDSVSRADVIREICLEGCSVDPDLYECGARINGDCEIIKRIEALPLAAEHPKCWSFENITDVSYFYSDESKWSDVSHMQSVVAWMPLPEPYEGGDAE